MKLSISNIGWSTESDTEVYQLMKEYGYSGLEIAPTRIFPKAPYDQIEKARIWSEELKRDYCLSISSMQSIWYGRQEKVFGSDEERKALLLYTKKAVDFAEAIGCGNLVFGCPQNRTLPDNVDSFVAIGFFRELGEYAAAHGTVIGMEANPPIYGTNYINDTETAFELIEQVASKGFLLNLDIGTMIQNGEDPNELKGRVHLINHVHVSEPGLKPIEKRGIHKTVRDILKAEFYQGFISIEMGNTDNVGFLERTIRYVGEVFV